jgi:hypothetical protein
VRSATWFAYASGAVSIVQLALLVLFYALGGPFGTLNDGAIVLQYLLAVPVMLALHRLLHPRAARASTIALMLGILGVLAISVLQVLLIVGVMPFAVQVGPVTAALFLLFGGWLLIAGYLGRSLPFLRPSLLMSIVGWTYLGYPVWAFWLGRRLRSAPPG